MIITIIINYYNKIKVTIIVTIIINSMEQRVILDKLIVTQLVNRFLVFYGTRRVITVFIRARQWSLS
jgi:hypothetical protein